MLAWFQWLVGLMTGGMKLFYGWTHSYGLAVILLTVVVRLVLVPIYQRQMGSLRKMQGLAPQIKKLQEKHKGEPQKLQQMTMQLYKDHKVNPAAGCLPMLIQLPILYALFQGLERFHYIGSSSFLWLQSLSKPDHLYILPVLAAVTTGWQTFITTPATMTQDKTQRNMMMIVMPLFIGYISIRFPAGLSLYWVMSNLFAIGQQYLMMPRMSLLPTREAKGD